ncbi:hypothetical protein RLOatenuis_2370 [Rickettsiales bacterium]|nr:hypothetical protein RLOatenuis_2370 [Rickettsiales bacterium]
MNDDAVSTNSWNFDNTCARLPEHFYARVCPIVVCEPRIVIINYNLANELRLSLYNHSEELLAQLFSGNCLPTGFEPIAQVYAGHQFAHFAMLGDG